jgi:hypothetical protein
MKQIPQIALKLKNKLVLGECREIVVQKGIRGLCLWYLTALSTFQLYRVGQFY